MSSFLLLTIVCMVASYLLCGIPFGMLIARAKGVDVRREGSGNIGMTNVARTVGGGAAAATLLLDLGKGSICILLARLLLSTLCLGGDWAMTAPQAPLGWAAAMVYAACVLGHIFSPYLGFHGGKGISVGFGACLGLSWQVAFGLLAVFLVLAVPSRYVSLGSVFAAASLPVWALVFGFEPLAVAPLAIVAAVVIWSHRANIARLRSGTERRFELHR